MELNQICNEVIAVAMDAGSFIRQEAVTFDTAKIEKKAEYDFVSYVDREAEKMIVDKLSLLLPGSGFIAEEGSYQKNAAGPNWVIDPLDGTNNFIHGLSPFAVSIALMQDGDVILGVIYEITRDECFYSWRGAPAYLNKRKISVSCAAAMRDCLVATSFPHSGFAKMDAYLESLDYVMRHSHDMRRLGSAAAHLAFVACGRIDAFYAYGMKPWDVAAGAFLVRQAGGAVADFHGRQQCIFGKDIIAANKNVFGEFKALLSRIMD